MAAEQSNGGGHNYSLLFLSIGAALGLLGLVLVALLYVNRKSIPSSSTWGFSLLKSKDKNFQYQSKKKGIQLAWRGAEKNRNYYNTFEEICSPDLDDQITVSTTEEITTSRNIYEPPPPPPLENGKGDISEEIVDDNVFLEKIDEIRSFPPKKDSLKEKLSRPTSLTSSPNASRQQLSRPTSLICTDEEEAEGYSQEAIAGSDEKTEISDSVEQCCGQLIASVSYNNKRREILVTIDDAQLAAELLPSENTNYYQVRVTLLPDNEQHHTTMASRGPNPEWSQLFGFSGVLPDDLFTDFLGFQILSNTDTGKSVPIAEATLHLDQLEDDEEHTVFTIDLFPLLVNVEAQTPCTAAIAAKDDYFNSSTKPQQQQPLNLEDNCNNHVSKEPQQFQLSIESLELVSTAAIENQIRAPPELLVGLMYSRNTGKLVVSVLKGQNFSALTDDPPESFVKVSMLSPYGDEIGKHKTAIKESTANPMFDETFVFQVSEHELCYVTLMISVFCLIGSWRRQVHLGWLSFGQNSSANELMSHWTEMSRADEENIARWHRLTEP